MNNQKPLSNSYIQKETILIKEFLFTFIDTDIYAFGFVFKTICHIYYYVKGFYFGCFFKDIVKWAY